METLTPVDSYNELHLMKKCSSCCCCLKCEERDREKKNVNSTTLFLSLSTIYHKYKNLNENTTDPLPNLRD